MPFYVGALLIILYTVFVDQKKGFITTTPGLNIAFYYFILVYFVKTSEKYLSFKENENLLEWKFSFRELKIKHRRIVR